MKYDIHYCARDEISDVMRYIHENWEKDHILSRDQALLGWQHGDGENERYNFVVGREGRSGAVLGVLGFIPTRIFDAALTDQNMLWLAFWSVRRDAGVGGLGLLLHNYVLTHETFRAVGSVGVNAYVAKVFSALGYRTGEMEQYYLLNPSIDTYRLARAPSGAAPARPAKREPERAAAILEPLPANASLAALPRMRLAERIAQQPTKSIRYFVNRFLRHPRYRYKLYWVMIGAEPHGVLALRRVGHAGARALRLVDYWGSAAALAACRQAFRQLVVREMAEYIDIFNHGIAEEVFAAAGFSKLDPSGDIVIPSHFEPFERRNVLLRYAFKSPNPEPFILFKADADQDRPSLRPNGCGVGS